MGPNKKFHILTEGVHIRRNDCLWYVYYKGFEMLKWHLVQRSRSKMLNICLTGEFLFHFMEGVHIWHNYCMVRRLQRKFQISDMTLESKVKVKYTLNLY